MKQLFLLFLLTAVLFSCQDDPVVPTSNSSIPLKVGNYWIYKTYNNAYYFNNPTLLREDSIYVDRYEIIQGDTFYVLKGVPSHMFGEYNQNGEVYLQDSSSFILSIDHKLLSIPYEEPYALVLNHDYTIDQGDTTHYYLDILLHSGDTLIKTPDNDSFLVQHIERYYYEEYDTFKVNPHNVTARLFVHCYKKGIGMVYDNENDTLHAFISRYHIEQ